MGKEYSLNWLLHNPNEQGWAFGCGEPEFWHYKDALVKPGGKVLDLGIGEGRTSFFFALHGMNVVGCDFNQERVDYVNEIAKVHKFPITAYCLDVREVEITGQFDMVVLGQLFVHFSSREEAYSVLDKAVNSLAPGGHLWIRAADKEDGKFSDFCEMVEYNPKSKVNNDVFLEPCDCSGTMKEEFHLY